jgi:hypothetical protein
VSQNIQIIWQSVQSVRQFMHLGKGFIPARYSYMRFADDPIKILAAHVYGFIVTFCVNNVIMV